MEHVVLSHTTFGMVYLLYVKKFLAQREVTETTKRPGQFDRRPTSEGGCATAEVHNLVTYGYVAG